MSAKNSYLVVSTSAETHATPAHARYVRLKLDNGASVEKIVA